MADEPRLTPPTEIMAELFRTSEMPAGWTWNDGKSGYVGAIMPAEAQQGPTGRSADPG